MARDSSRRRGGTRAERGQRTAGGPAQLPWRQVRNSLPPMEILRPEQIEAIHDTSMRILEEVGMDFLHPRALDILRQAGAEVEPGSERVRFDRGLIEESIAKAPSEFRLHARNPAHHLAIGGNNITFASVASPRSMNRRQIFPSYSPNSREILRIAPRPPLFRSRTDHLPPTPPLQFQADAGQTAVCCRHKRPQRPLHPRDHRSRQR